MQTVRIGGRDVSRFILGSNPFSGFSHQGREMDRQMMSYWTCERVKAALRQAESLGINTIIARADFHVLRLLMEYRDEGGRIQWFAQTCPEIGPPEKAMDRVAEFGAPACYIHGGYADHLLAGGRLEELIPTVDHARELGLAVGLAAHDPRTIHWAERNLKLDYYMCSYYNPIPRKAGADHVSGTAEAYRDEDRRAMTELIQGLSRPAIHYKVMAAGRNDPAEALHYAAARMRPGDAVCVGIFTRDKADMLAEDVRLLGECLAGREGAPTEAPA
ncbi:MAG: hypothetical protein ACYS8K_00895 [Planctomycetota bacterium]|jgi:hypothetical protein